MSYVVICEDIPDGSGAEDLSDDDDIYRPPDDCDPLESTDGEEYEEDNEDGQDQPQPSTSRSNKSKPKHTWVPGNFNYTEEDSAFLGDLQLTPELMALKTPIQIFDNFFTEDMIQMILTETTRYASQEGNDTFEITNTEIKQFLGILIYMSVVPYPTTRHYWNVNMEFEPISMTMSCNRFEEIKRYLHFVNNESILQPSHHDYDKLQKIRPFLNKLRDTLRAIPKEEYLAVDEQIIPTKTRKSSLKQYNPRKPHKWGYKVYVLSGVSGFSYDFDLYAEKQSDVVPEGAPNLGTSSNVVVRLTECLPDNMNHKIFFDNWFTSIELMTFMHKKGVLPLGTVRPNRLGGAEIPTKRQMTRMGRGSSTEQHTEVDDTTVVLVSWLDNKIVNLCSTYVGANPTSTVRRYNRRIKRYEEVTCPKAVQLYNRHMGGVDTLDSMLGYYRIRVRSKKWYLRVFFHMIDLICVNSWLLWRRTNAENDIYMPLLDFKLAIAEVLTKKDSLIYTPRTRGRPVAVNEDNDLPPPKKSRRKIDIPPREVAEDGVHHFPDWTANRKRCRLVDCGKQTFIWCIKCKMYLCINKERNCFLEFHTP